MISLPIAPSLAPAIAGAFKKQQPWLGITFRSLLGGVFSTAIAAIPVLGAEQISVISGPFQLSLPVKALEVYAQEGKVTDDFAFYAKRATPQQLTQLRQLLQIRLPLSSVPVSQVTYSPIGETLLQGLGQILETESGQNGFYGLRAALILAAADPQGLTVLNLLRRFPADTVQLNLDQAQQLTQELSQRRQAQKTAIATIQQKAKAEAAAQSSKDFRQHPDLRQSGSFLWQRQTLTLSSGMPIDLYLPQFSQTTQKAPVIVISHGAGCDRSSFAYLAEHLASYGFGVVVLEHPGSNARRFRQFLAGLGSAPDAKDLISRPLEVTAVLDQLQRQAQADPSLQRLNLKQVGVIGQSLGGYTALALAGAQMDTQQLDRTCPQERLNLARLVQCQVKPPDTPPATAQDPRIKAIVAINPVTSSLLGPKGVSQIQVPTMILASGNDTVAPALPEQIRPFTALNSRYKYLALIDQGTHFSTLGPVPAGQEVFPIPLGPAPAIARDYLKALSIAFFQTHLAQQPEFQLYLSSAYAQFISQEPLNLSLLESLAADSLTEP